MKAPLASFGLLVVGIMLVVLGLASLTPAPTRAAPLALVTGTPTEPLPPTATSTLVPPTNTPTNVPVVPTDTPQPPPDNPPTATPTTTATIVVGQATAIATPTETPSPIVATPTAVPSPVSLPTTGASGGGTSGMPFLLILGLLLIVLSLLLFGQRRSV